MSEELAGSTPTEQPQDDQTQFDADAAQKAKKLLEEGVTRGEGEGRETSDVKKGDVLNEDGRPFPTGLRRIAEFHKGIDDYAAMRILQRESGIQSANKKPPVTGGWEPESYKKTQQRWIDKHTASRELSLQNAKTHLEQNRAGYETIAIEDATAAGHDINYGGHHFPAQNTEQHELQGEQTVEPQEPQPQ